jgi:glycolate oxidase
VTFWKKEPFQALEKSIGKGKIFTQPEDIALYGIDATHYRGTPAAVVLAEETSDIQEVVRYAVKEGLSVTARGAGSGLSAGSVPIEGGLVLSLEKMRKIDRINLKDRTVIVQPGVVTTDLQTEAGRYNLFYPPDPSSHTISTIGGNVAENAGGLRCFKYGVTSHYIRGIEYVNAEGELTATGSLAGESYEPDLTPILVGSEGTLGIFSRIELQLVLRPPRTITLAAYFSDRSVALRTVEGIIQAGLVPSIIEFIDRLALIASAEFCGIQYPDQAQALLLIETDGTEEEAESAASEVSKLLSVSATHVTRAKTESERDSLWQLRRGISPSLNRLSPGRIHEDVAVPRGSLEQLLRAIDIASQKYSLTIPVYGHAGDGNLHVVILYDIASNEAGEAARKASEEIFRAAIEMGGTITGEHGIGYAKRDYLPWQLPVPILNISRQLKKQFDPNGVFNPGKILHM